MGESLELVGRHRDGSKFPFEIGLNLIRTHEDLPVLRELPDEFFFGGAFRREIACDVGNADHFPAVRGATILRPRHGIRC